MDEFGYTEPSYEPPPESFYEALFEPTYEPPSMDPLQNPVDVDAPQWVKDWVQYEYVPPTESPSTQYEWPSETRFVKPVIENPNGSFNSLLDVLGKVIDVGGKTYSQIYAMKTGNIQKTNSKNINPLLLPLQKKSQEGLDTGIYVSPKSTLDFPLAGKERIIQGIPNGLLLIGAGIAIVFLVKRR